MWNYNYPDELYHYGRKGMRWYQHIFGKANNVSVSGSKRNVKKEEKEKIRNACEEYKLIDKNKKREGIGYKSDHKSFKRLMQNYDSILHTANI